MKGFNTRLSLKEKIVDNTKILISDKIYIKAFLEDKIFPEIPIDIVNQYPGKYLYDSSATYSVLRQLLDNHDQDNQDMIDAILTKENNGYKLYYRLSKFILDVNPKIYNIISMGTTPTLQTSVINLIKTSKSHTFRDCVNVIFAQLLKEYPCSEYINSANSIGFLSSNHDHTLDIFRFFDNLYYDINNIKDKDEYLKQLIADLGFTGEIPKNSIMATKNKEPREGHEVIAEYIVSAVNFICTILRMVQILINIYELIGTLSFMYVTEEYIQNNKSFNILKYNNDIETTTNLFDSKFDKFVEYILSGQKTFLDVYSWAKNKYTTPGNYVSIQHNIDFIRSFSGDGKKLIEDYLVSAKFDIASINNADTNILEKAIIKYLFQHNIFSIIINNAFFSNVVATRTFPTMQKTNEIIGERQIAEAITYINRSFPTGIEANAWIFSKILNIMEQTIFSPSDTITCNFFIDSIIHLFIKNILYAAIENKDKKRAEESTLLRQITDFRSHLDNIIYDSITFADIVELDKIILSCKINLKQSLGLKLDGRSIGFFKYTDEASHDQNYKDNYVHNLIRHGTNILVSKLDITLSSYINDNYYNYNIRDIIERDVDSIFKNNDVLISELPIKNIVINSVVNILSFNILSKAGIENKRISDFNSKCVNLLETNNDMFWLSAIDRKLTNALYKSISISNSNNKEYKFVPGKVASINNTASARDKLLTYALVTDDINIENIIKVYNHEAINNKNILFYDDSNLKATISNLSKLNLNNILDPLSSANALNDKSYNNVKQLFNDKVSYINTVFTDRKDQSNDTDLMAPSFVNNHAYDMVCVSIDKQLRSIAECSNFPYSKNAKTPPAYYIFYSTYINFINFIHDSTPSDDAFHPTNTDTTHDDMPPDDTFRTTYTDTTSDLQEEGSEYSVGQFSFEPNCEIYSTNRTIFKIDFSDLYRSYFGSYCDFMPPHFQPLLLYFFPNRCETALCVDSTYGLSPYFGGYMFDDRMYLNDKVHVIPSRLIFNPEVKVVDSNPARSGKIKDIFSKDNFTPKLSGQCNSYDQSFVESLKNLYVNETSYMLYSSMHKTLDLLKYLYKSNLNKYRDINYSIDAKHLITSDLYYYTSNIEYMFIMNNLWKYDSSLWFDSYHSLDVDDSSFETRTLERIKKHMQLLSKILIDYNIMNNDIGNSLYNILRSAFESANYKDVLKWTDGNMEYKIPFPKNIIDITTLFPANIVNTTTSVSNIITTNIITKDGIFRNSCLSDGDLDITAEYDNSVENNETSIFF